ncbi:MAG TPA: hypothetical protein VH619_19455 [Verrucomicrobiae bacterium]|nr:hypothetical protein [Verrucomicrobiae bacterium]
MDTAVDRNRWAWFVLCLAVAGLMLLCGWLIPMHLRAVDPSVLHQAGVGTPSLVERGLALAHAQQTDSARLILQAAQYENISAAGELALALSTSTPAKSTSEKATPYVIRLENRERVLNSLSASDSPAIQELLHGRDLTNTILFPPSSSASGQAFDAAVSVTGRLLQDNAFEGLRGVLVSRSATANHGGDTQPLEVMLMDVMSLGERFDWQQLEAYVHNINDPRTLDLLAEDARNAGDRLPELFAAVELSQQPDKVAGYLANFSITGLHDLGVALRYGAGGVNELTHRNQQLYDSPLRRRLTASGPLGLFFRAGTDYALRVPWFALTLKWFFYLSCGFLVALALHFARPPVAPIEEPLRVRGVHLARETLFALGFLFVVLLLSEPFLAQEGQKAEVPFRLRLPTVGAAAASSAPSVKPKLVMTTSLLTLLIFFVLQALLYCACLVKLAEIRRQNVPPRVRLRLLENEEHLFDAGLYLGFGGTIVCLILASMGLTQFSLMAAYSCTSFGILFVSIFKIFQLRPVRRQLLMQAETERETVETAAPARTTFVPTT